MTHFCKLAEVRAAVDAEETFTGHDTVIMSNIKQAAALIRTYTRRQWDMAQYIDFVNSADINVGIGQGGIYRVSLREKPVSIAVGLAPVVHYSPSGRWDDTDALDPSSYQVDTRLNQIIMYPYTMKHNPRSLRITYNAGFLPFPASDPADPADDIECLQVPDNIRCAAIAQAAYLTRRHLNSISGTNRKDSQERMAAYGALNVAGLCRDALALLRTEVRLFMGTNE